MTTRIVDEDTIQPLVPIFTSAGNPRLPWWRRYLARAKLSRAAVVILVWNVIIGATYSIISNGGLSLMFAVDNNTNVIVCKKHDFHPALYMFLGAIMFISTIQFFLYPLGGLLADIKYGRYKILVISTAKIWCGYGFFILLIFLLAFTKKRFEIHRTDNGPIITDFQVIAIGIAVIFLIIGFSGYQANVVQFGLDQFLDAPSEKLSLFVHWFVWTDTLGQTTISFVASVIPCAKDMIKVITFAPVLMLAILTTVMVISYYNRHWFHREPCTHNPYGTVYRVLKFAAQHDRPLRPSAFTYSDDERPTRIEFAKQRFGGPFTTETVEDVKTFLRILVMLVFIGPTYIVMVSAKYLFPLHGIYTITRNLFDSDNGTCKTLDWVLLASGNLSYLVSVFFLPFYIIILPCVTKYLPRIVLRIGIGAVLLLVADLSMTLTLFAGQYHFKGNRTCLFNSDYSIKHHHDKLITLGLHQSTLVIPQFFTGLAMPLIYISILEFISAQSPHSMKGVLLGVFYAVRGLFTVLGCVLVFPFTSERIWGRRENTVLDCGLSYYVASVLLGLVGVLLFYAAARWYQYRRREDQPFGPHYAEAAYERQIRERECEVANEAPAVVLHDHSGILDYGTMVGPG